MKSSCFMITVLLAIAVVNASSKTMHEASRSEPAAVSLSNRLKGLLARSGGMWTSGSRKKVAGGENTAALADEMRTGERTQKSNQILKACMTKEACQKKAAVCSKKRSSFKRARGMHC